MKVYNIIFTNEKTHIISPSPVTTNIDSVTIIFWKINRWLNLLLLLPGGREGYYFVSFCLVNIIIL